MPFDLLLNREFTSKRRNADLVRARDSYFELARLCKTG